ncbi:MAG: helix-turn-helix transcriptional regulator [Sulfuricaulis sp.]
MKDKLLTTKEAACYLGVSEAFLERDRWAGARIPYIKVGSRAVRYRPLDLEVFLQSHTLKSTSERAGLS